MSNSILVHWGSPTFATIAKRPSYHPFVALHLKYWQRFSGPASHGLQDYHKEGILKAVMPSSSCIQALERCCSVNTDSLDKYCPACHQWNIRVPSSSSDRLVFFDQVPYLPRRMRECPADHGFSSSSTAIIRNILMFCAQFDILRSLEAAEENFQRLETIRIDTWLTRTTAVVMAAVPVHSVPERSSPPFWKFSFAIPEFVDDMLNNYMNTLLLNQNAPDGAKMSYERRGGRRR